ncbi:BRCA1-A complex subunit Abraxas 1 [Ricinus communis]|uniref:BRCA1-A complex subunit Abraxas n=1 Tax=Ricinus communis TaxID=3988 RepID=B9SL12_RICCO|nr:BRCA1-A complex subunit Abraxas 1 [Ricinus communis]EEF35703.1 conserved hypothetical protein [Ricinus communis]|eukprot:XP_002526681.1 BRCA1-A complex subunit Abraxas 1 [Ricinus communis]
MEDLPIQKVAISGPTLASIIQRISSSLGDADGLLFGHVSHIAPSTLSDDSHLSDSDSDHQLIATVTSFLCPNSPLSFYDSLGRVNSPNLLRLLSQTPHNHHFLGWFSGRRKTPLRPSMREFSVSRSLSSSSQFLFPIKNLINKTLSPCIFLLYSTPLQDQLIHTHDYRAYQFRHKTLSFDPKPIDIVNIGPAFRGHYGNFSPSNSGLPMLNCEVSGLSAMNEDSLSERKQINKDQKELNMCAEDFEVKNLSRLIGPEASSYTLGLENLYEKMLVKIESLARQVEISDTKVLAQENVNRKLRYKVARTGLE